MLAAHTTHWGFVFVHLDWKFPAIGYPAPKLAIRGGLPAGLQFKTYANGTAAIVGKPSVSWLKVIEVAATTAFTLFTDGLGALAIGKLLVKGTFKLFTTATVTIVAANSFGRTTETVRINIIGPN